MDLRCQGRILGPTYTLNLVCRQLSISAMRSSVIFPLASSPPEADKHFQHLVPEQLRDLFAVRRRRDGEHPVFMKPAVGHQHVAVGIVPEEISEGLDDVDRRWSQHSRG